MVNTSVEINPTQADSIQDDQVNYYPINSIISSQHKHLKTTDQTPPRSLNKVDL